MRIDVLGGGVNSAVGRAHIAAMKLDGSADIALARFANEEAVNLVSTESFGLQNTLLANSSVDFFFTSGGVGRFDCKNAQHRVRDIQFLKTFH